LELAAEAAALRDLAAKEGARGGCKANCQAVLDKAEQAAQRLEEARQARAGLSPFEASGLAAMVTMVAGGDAETIARWLGAVKAGLFILLVEALVWLAVPAAGLLGAACRRRRAVDVMEAEMIVVRAAGRVAAPARRPCPHVAPRPTIAGGSRMSVLTSPSGAAWRVERVRRRGCSRDAQATKSTAAAPP
jgi:hypothetical protein